MSEPLDVYHEVRVDGRRRFELHPDRLVIVGKTANVNFETTIDLSEVKPHPDTLWIRHKWFQMAVFMFLGSFLALIATVATRGTAPERESLIVMLGSLSFGLLFVGLVVASYTYPRIKFLRFKSSSGLVRFDVACSGPDRERFDLFVGEVTERIAANQKGGAAGSDHGRG